MRENVATENPCAQPGDWSCATVSFSYANFSYENTLPSLTSEKKKRVSPVEQEIRDHKSEEVMVQNDSSKH